MSRLAIIDHGAHGHTEHIARQVRLGALEVDGVDVRSIKAEDIASTPDVLVDFDGFILGSPAYLGGVSGSFKSFMDATGRLWRTRQLKGKLAAGFTVSSLSSGDKQSTLLSMFVFSMKQLARMLEQTLDREMSVLQGLRSLAVGGRTDVDRHEADRWGTCRCFALSHTSRHPRCLKT